MITTYTPAPKQDLVDKKADKLQLPIANPNWETGHDAFPPEATQLTPDRRTEARLCVVQALAQHLLAKQPLAQVELEFVGRLGKRKADKSVWTRVWGSATDASTNAPQRFMDLLAAERLPNWDWPRMDPVLRATMWAASAELASTPDLPTPILISEYLNIARGFLPDEDVKYLQKSLAGVASKIRP
jgi:transcription antitermination protein NusB